MIGRPGLRGRAAMNSGEVKRKRISRPRPFNRSFFLRGREPPVFDPWLGLRVDW